MVNNELVEQLFLEYFIDNALLISEDINRRKVARDLIKIASDFLIQKEDAQLLFGLVDKEIDKCNTFGDEIEPDGNDTEYMTKLKQMSDWLLSFVVE